jgi:hypothetical protein
MIRSRIANFTVLLFGLVLLAVVFAPVWNTAGQHGWRQALNFTSVEVFLVVTLGGSGLWCVIGALSNLRSMTRSHSVPLPAGPRRVHQLLFVLAGLSVIVMIAALPLSVHSSTRAPQVLAGLGVLGIIVSIVRVVLSISIPDHRE